MKRAPLLVLLVAFALPAFGAGLEAFQFGDRVPEQRYKALVAQLRCLVCQNQSLLDSDADLAHDLRQEVYDMMAAGRSGGEGGGGRGQRYGDFVLYKPPVEPRTWVIWYGPFALLLAGLGVLVHTLRKRSRQPPPAFSAEEQARLDALLGDKEKDA